MKFFYHPRTSGSAKVLHERLLKHYIGISRRFIKKILSHQEVNILKARTHRPDPSRGVILHGRFPMHISEADTVFMPKNIKLNHEFRYIFTIVNIYSRKVGAQPIKRKFAKDVLEALKIIYKRWGKGLPRIFGSDQGTEMMGEVNIYLLKNGVKRYYSKPYSPLSVIERHNGIIRKNLNKFMNIYKTKVWVDILQHVVNNVNDTIYQNIKTREFLFNLKNRKEINSYYDIMLEHAQKRLKKKTFKFKNILKVGDEVRLSLKKEKQEMTKEGSENVWSSRIYHIKKIIKTNRGIDRYILDEKPGHMYHRTQLLKNPSYMQGKTYDDKPIFDPKFNIERNLKKAKEKITNIAFPRRTARLSRVPWTPRRGKRVRKKVVRYGGKIDPLTHILKY